MGVELLPEVCSPLDPGSGRGGILRLSLFRTFATQIFLKFFSETVARNWACFVRVAGSLGCPLAIWHNSRGCVDTGFWP